MNPATMSGSTIDIVVAKWIVAVVGVGISFLIKVRLSFVADRLTFRQFAITGNAMQAFRGLPSSLSFQSVPAR